jgi:DNA-directed RNA polymerase subunit RPC12/RpoP
MAATRARCVNCREEVTIPDQYAHGDHIACGTCGTKHRVVRGDRVRLVMADVTPLRDALAQNQRTANRIQAELAQARASFGIGANGLGIGVAFAVYQVGWKGEPLSMNLLWNAIGIALVAGLLLEAANWAFLAKRQAITRLTEELQEVEQEAHQIRQKIRDATRL